MSVTLRSQASATAASGVGTALSATSQVGDLAVLVYSCQLVNNSGPSPIPSGWDGTHQGSLDNKRGGYVASLRVTDPAQTQNITWWVLDPFWTARQNATLLVFAGVESVAVTQWQATPPTYTAETFVAAQTHGSSFAQFGEWDSTPAGTVITPGTGTVSTAASWSALRVVDAPAGSTVSAPASGLAPSHWAAFTLTAKEETPAQATGFPVTLGDGKVAALTVWDGSKEAKAASIRSMPYGARTVAELVAKPRFVVAHRGGSASWPEHTQRAYTQAVAYGVDALEISCNRSSDGVWFGMHDRDFSRLGGPATDASTMTWGQIETAMGSTRYMPARLDWLLTTYGASHVIVFDPKYRAALSSEYLSILAPYKDSVILKYSGEGTTLFKTWADAGFKTWAYGYASWKTDGTSNWTNFISDANKTILSMQYDATQSIWDEVKAVGKPTTSHIPANGTQVQTGWDRGADGTIAAGVSSALNLKV